MAFQITTILGARPQFIKASTVSRVLRETPDVEERIIHRSKQEQRSDDNIDVIKTRLDKYIEETYPVSQFFSENFGQYFFTIDASQEVSKIQKELMNIIKKGQK